MSEEPLYVSRRLFRNLWQRYRIYADRVELQFFTCRKIVRAAGSSTCGSLPMIRRRSCRCASQ